MSDTGLPVQKFRMHSASGEQRVSRLIDRVTSKSRSGRGVLIMLWTGLMSIERRSPAVRSDVVRESTCRALEDYCGLTRLERVNNSEF